LDSQFSSWGFELIFISHRGNLNGVDPERENSPEYINKCLALGFDCEIDLRMKNGIPHLGHDTPDYQIDAEWILKRSRMLWIHVKEYGALIWLLENCPDSTYFCHESDRYTLVSNGMVWSHDLSNQMNEYCVIPLLSKESVDSYGQVGFGAVCSDFIYDCVAKFRKETP
jgi:hypothetical protein